VDVERARRLGAEFLEHGEIMRHLNALEPKWRTELAEARAAGRGKTFIAKLENRLRALEKAREYAQLFQEGHGVNSIPGRAVTPVRGATLPEAVAGERALLRNFKAFRYGGRVLLVVGAGMSIARVASAPPGQQGRVAAGEAGGWAFSLGGAALGAKAGAGAGLLLGFESGPGALIAAAIGSLIGAALGFAGGEAAAEEIYDVGEAGMDRLRDASEMLRDPARLVEGATIMFGSEQDRRNYYELREIETGEPSPYSGF
jgi:hypothetical protein